MVVHSEGVMGYDFRDHGLGVLELQFDFEVGALRMPLCLLFG